MIKLRNSNLSRAFSKIGQQRKQMHDSFGYAVCQVGVCLSSYWNNLERAPRCLTHATVLHILLCTCHSWDLSRIITMQFSSVFSHFFSIASWHRQSADYKVNISFSTRHEKILSYRIRLWGRTFTFEWSVCPLGASSNRVKSMKQSDTIITGV